MSKILNAGAGCPLAYQVKLFCNSVGISPATFYKYVNLGEIRIIKIGGRTLVPASEVERLLSGGAARLPRRMAQEPCAGAR